MHSEYPEDPAFGEGLEDDDYDPQFDEDYWDDEDDDYVLPEDCCSEDDDDEIPF